MVTSTAPPARKTPALRLKHIDLLMGVDESSPTLLSVNWDAFGRLDGGQEGVDGEGSAPSRHAGPGRRFDDPVCLKVLKVLLRSRLLVSCKTQSHRIIIFKANMNVVLPFRPFAITLHTTNPRKPQ